VSSTPRMKRDSIVEDLRRRILSNEISRGARLRQNELANELASSITPVREALRILEAEGLVVSEPHKGVRVAGIDLERIKALYIVRRLVETYAMRRAALRLSPLDMAQAESIADSMQAAFDEGDIVAYRSLNRKFHFYFYQRCGLPALHDQIAAMWKAFPWDLSLDSLECGKESMDEHRSIIKALRGGDSDEVGRATEDHLERGFRTLVSKAAGVNTPDPFRLDVD